MCTVMALRGEEGWRRPRSEGVGRSQLRYTGPQQNTQPTYTCARVRGAPRTWLPTMASLLVCPGMFQAVPQELHNLGKVGPSTRVADTVKVWLMAGMECLVRRRRLKATPSKGLASGLSAVDAQ